MAGSVAFVLFCYTCGSCNNAYCCEELAVSSLALVVMIICTHCTYPHRDAQATLAWVADWLVT